MLTNKRFFTVKNFLVKKFDHQKKIYPKKFVAVKKHFLDYNLIILREIVIMAGILNHSIVYIIEKTSDDVKTILSAFFPPIMLQDL